MTTKAKSKPKPKPKAKKPFQLDLESGRVIKAVEAHQLQAAIEAEEFAILGTGSRGNTYLQCARQDKAPFEYILEYQDGSIDKHYAAVHKGIPIEKIVAAFTKYLAGDRSWKSDFRWKRLDLS